MQKYCAECFGTFWLVLGGLLGAAVYKFIGKEDNV